MPESSADIDILGGNTGTRRRALQGSYMGEDILGEHRHATLVLYGKATQMGTLRGVTHCSALQSSNTDGDTQQ